MHIILMILLINVLIFIHELGHYTAARLVGIKPKKAIVGFGKTLYSYVDKQGIVYEINLIPLLGAVMFEDGVFNEQHAWKRFVVIISGVICNFIFALFLSLLFVLIFKMPFLLEGSEPVSNLNIGQLLTFSYQTFVSHLELLAMGIKEVFGGAGFEQLSGPIRIIADGSALLSNGIRYLIPLTIMLDLNIMLINGLPFPGLDGGRLVFISFELLFGKRLSFEKYFHMVGMVLLLMFIGFTLVKDIISFV